MSENHLFDLCRIAPKVANSRLVAMLLEAQRWMTLMFFTFNIHSDIHSGPFFGPTVQRGAESSEAGCGTLQLLQLLVCSVGHALYSSSRRVLIGVMESWQSFVVETGEAWRPQL